jgi:hypothetical protein
MKICLEIQIWLLSDKNIGNFTWRTKHALLLPGDIKWRQKLSSNVKLYQAIRVAEEE